MNRVMKCTSRRGGFVVVPKTISTTPLPTVEKEDYLLTLTVCIPVSRPRSLGKDGKIRVTKQDREEKMRIVGESYKSIIL